MADAWSLRQLCDDGACTGVIGADGRCKVCGRAAQNWGDERRRGLLDEDAEALPPAEAPARAAKRTRPSTGTGGGGDFEARRLCPDGACVGLLDARGVCKVCGAVDETAAHGDAAFEDRDGDDEGDVDDPDAASAAVDGDRDDDDDGVEDDDAFADAAGAGDDDDGEEDDDEDDDVPAARASERLAADDEDAGDDRRLCPDGGCVGLIGADGRCKVCGRASDDAP